VTFPNAVSKKGIFSCGRSVATVPFGKPTTAVSPLFAERKLLVLKVRKFSFWSIVQFYSFDPKPPV